MVLASERSKDRLARYVGNYRPGQEFLYLWWPQEGYKPCNDSRGEPCLGLDEAVNSLVDRGKWREFLDFYVYRKTDIEHLSHRAVAYFPKETAEP